MLKGRSSAYQTIFFTTLSRCATDRCSTDVSGEVGSEVGSWSERVEGKAIHPYTCMKTATVTMATKDHPISDAGDASWLPLTSIEMTGKTAGPTNMPTTLPLCTRIIWELFWLLGVILACITNRGIAGTVIAALRIWIKPTTCQKATFPLEWLDAQTSAAKAAARDANTGNQKMTFRAKAC